MQPFENAVMLNAGIKLLNDAQSGECKIEFTRIAIGDGTYSDEEKKRDSLVQMKSLKNEKRSYAIASKEKVNDNAIILKTLISNYDDVEEKALITEGFYINEIAVFARAQGTEEEIMYSIAVTSVEKGDYMPAYNGYNPAQIIQTYLVSVNNSSNTKIVVKNEAYVLQEDFYEMQTKVEEFESAVLDTTSIETAFNSVFQNIPETTDQTAMTESDVEAALETEWTGESSPDPTALQSSDVEDALTTEWNGESSSDPDALNAKEIEEVTT